MKILISILSLINLYLGGKNFLNVIGVLQDSKYSRGATLVFAILFLSMGILALYFAFIKQNSRLALYICFGPWVLALLIMFVSMITSRPN